MEYKDVVRCAYKDVIRCVVEPDRGSFNRLFPAMQGVSHGVLEAVARDTICARAGQFSSKEIPRQAAFHHSYTERG